MRAPWTLERHVTFNHGKGSYAGQREEVEQLTNALIKTLSEQIIKC